jgi:hypothetical protein
MEGREDACQRCPLQSLKLPSLSPPLADWIVLYGRFADLVCFPVWLPYFIMQHCLGNNDGLQIGSPRRDPVYDFAWLQSKTGTECMSVASDGSVLWWDIRKLAEPVETLNLAEKGSDKVLGAVSLEYSPQAGPTKFLLGTEQGLIISGNRKAKTPADRIGTSYTGPYRNALIPPLVPSKAVCV